MKKLAFALALASSACAAPEPAASPVDVHDARAARVAFAPPGTMDIVYDETPARSLEVAAPATSLRAGICEKPRHLFVAP
jgi:hypothetical protein